MISLGALPVDLRNNIFSWFSIDQLAVIPRIDQTFCTYFSANSSKILEMIFQRQGWPVDQVSYDLGIHVYRTMKRAKPDWPIESIAHVFSSAFDTLILLRDGSSGKPEDQATPSSKLEAILKAAPHLTSLTVACKESPADFIAAINRSTSTLKDLRLFSMSANHLLEDCHLKMLAQGQPLLQSLEVNGCTQLRGGCIDAFITLKDLQKLQMRGSQLFESSALLKLKDIPHLTMLCLINVSNPDLIDGVSQCSKLTHLSLIDCDLTDDQIRSLKLPSLEFLDVEENDDLTEAGLANLQVSLPYLKEIKT